LHIAAAEHGIEAQQGLYGPYQHNMGHALRAGDYVKKVVNAVAQVDVSPAAGLEHHAGALGKSVEVGMAGFVVGGAVGLCFYDAPGGELAVEAGYEAFAQQLLCQGYGIGALVKIGA
jgi:hypothetical protein